MASVGNLRVRAYQVVPAEVDSFQAEKIFSRYHILRLGIYNIRPFGHVISPVIPIVVELIEVNRQINWKRGDYFYFNWYNLECEYHGFCELPLKKPMDTTGHHDTDISKLIEHQDIIAELLQQSRNELPALFRDNIVINALMNKGFDIRA